MDPTPEHSLARAKQVVWRLLARRDHGERELAQRLARKGFSREVVAGTIAYFRDLGYLDDRLFAVAQTRRLAAGKGWGNRRLLSHLRERGISEPLAEEAVAAVRQEWSEEQAIVSLIKNKTKKRPLKGDPKGKQQLYRFLLGRGFPPGLICELIKRAEEEDGHDDDGE